MSSTDEDFSRFLKANFEDDWRRYSSPDVSNATINSITKKHEETYSIWKKLSSDDWIRAFYGDKLPPELLSGHISPEYLRIHMQEYMYSPLIYKNEEVIAIRTQYVENLPNMVYSVEPLVEIDKFRQMATDAGLCEKSLDTAVEHETDKWKYMAKLESVGLTEDEANQHIRQLKTIDAIEQISQTYQACLTAKTAEEKAIADKNLRAQCILHFDTLKQNKDLLSAIKKQLIEDEQKSSTTDTSLDPVVSDKSEKSTINANPKQAVDIEQKSSVSTVTPKPVVSDKSEKSDNSNLKITNIVQETISQPVKIVSPEAITSQPLPAFYAKSISTENISNPNEEASSVYAFAAQHLDEKVFAKLHHLDEYITANREKYSLSSETAAVPKNALQQLNIRPDEDIGAKYLRTRSQSFKRFAKDLTAKFEYDTAESMYTLLAKNIEDIRSSRALCAQYLINSR